MAKSLQIEVKSVKISLQSPQSATTPSMLLTLEKMFIVRNEVCHWQLSCETIFSSDAKRRYSNLIKSKDILIIPTMSYSTLLLYQ